MSKQNASADRVDDLERQIRDLADTVGECVYRIRLIERELVALLDDLARRGGREGGVR
jgi:hypothetical protein